MWLRTLSLNVSTYAAASSGVTAILPADRPDDYWFDANVLSSMYTDALKNSNVTTSGDPVGYMNDLAE